jgi:hypothetical protein
VSAALYVASEATMRKKIPRQLFRPFDRCKYTHSQQDYAVAPPLGTVYNFLLCGDEQTSIVTALVRTEVGAQIYKQAQFTVLKFTQRGESSTTRSSGPKTNSKQRCVPEQVVDILPKTKANRVNLG